MSDHLWVVKQDTAHHGIHVIPVSTVGKSPRGMTAMQTLHMATDNPYHWARAENPWIQLIGGKRQALCEGVGVVALRARVLYKPSYQLSNEHS